MLVTLLHKKIENVKYHVVLKFKIPGVGELQKSVPFAPIVVSMVFLESCSILSPSMFTHTLMYDGGNFCQRRTFGARDAAIATQHIGLEL